MSLFCDIHNICGYTVPSKEKDTWKFLEFSKRKVNFRYWVAKILNVFGTSYISVRGVPIEFENAIIVDIYSYYGRVCYCYL